MPVDHGRRTVLSGTAAALLLSLGGAARVRSESAAAQTPSKKSQNRLLTITYPSGASVRFDANYYRDHHVKLFMDIYGSAIERFELRTLTQSQAPAFSALINIWIADFDQFHTRSTPEAYGRMGEDKKNFTNASSAIQVDEVTYEAGEPRAAVQPGSGCLSLLYPAGQAGAWDNEARCRTYAEGLKSLFGRNVIRRIELRKGIEQLDDGSPAYQGGINLYVRNASTFAESWQRNRLAVQKLSAQLCSASPVELNTIVYGVDTTHTNA
jgi:hypothetical protein